nr:Ig-like domain-containing protein [Rhodobacter sp.]
MPIYVESRGVIFNGQSIAEHQYLVYVPLGQEDNYDAWLTIGAFPDDDGLLFGQYIDVPLSSSVGDDTWTISDFHGDSINIVATQTGNFPTVQDMVTAGYAHEAAASRARETVFDGGSLTNEDTFWNSLVAYANDLSLTYNYLALDAFGFGPTLNSNSFVSSVLRWAAVNGAQIDNLQTAPYTPGAETWLGLPSNDVMNANVSFAGAADVEHLAGGDGADTLIGNSGDNFLIAGDDADIDVLNGGGGTDVLVGYFNQADLGSSDAMNGGEGSDTIYVVDPALWLPGGIPDLQVEAGTPGFDFTHNGTLQGTGGFVDGGTGPGLDKLDYRYVAGPVHLLLDGVNIKNIDEILLTNSNDRVYVADISGYDVVNGRKGWDRFSIAENDQGIFIADEPGFLDPGYRLEPADGLGALQLRNFEEFITTDYDDEASFLLYDENGDEVTSGFRITAFVADGDDTLLGSGAHDNLYGGLGSDSIDGNDGADYIFDNGADSPIGENETPDAFLNRVLAYDTEGDDTIDGGAGSDVFVHSGGVDEFTGGPGHDTYLTVAEVHGTYGLEDNLTIVLSEDPGDPTTWFGNDLIVGDGRGIDLVRFEGITSSEVTISYSFEEVFIGSAVAEFNAHFWWNLSVPPQTYDYYQTIGSYEIRVNATGSSIVVEDVRGYHVRGDNPSQLGGVEASMSAPFVVEFDDGFMSWPDNVLDASNANYTFENSTLGTNAFAARGALEEERAVPEVSIDGTAEDEDIYATSGSDRINAGNGNDTILAGSGDDILIGGAGEDRMDGQEGNDTASYETATAAVGAYLDPGRFSIVNDFGDAAGDDFISIENLRGSDFDDRLYGDEAANLIEGGLGDDTIRGLGGLDTLKGGAGDDEIIAGIYIDDDDILYVSDTEMDGGDGNDTIQSSSGNDLMIGGEGNDTFELSSFVNIFDPGTPGNDTVDGGAGVDRVEFWSGPVVVDLGAGVGQYVGTTETVKLIDVEDVQGSREDDLIIGSDDDNVLDGDGGNDTLVGGGGNDQLYADSFSFSGQAVMHGGTGIDTAHVLWSLGSVTIDVIEGGLVIANGASSYTIYDDVETIQFSDVSRTYQELAQSLITEFAVIDDYIRVDESATLTLDLLGNDLEYQSDPITIQTLNGEAVTPGATIRLSSGAVINVEADGSLTFDQGGAYAWLDANESAMTTLTYTATDSTAVQRTATATLIVDGVDTASNRIHLDRNVYLTETDPDEADALLIGNFDVARTILIVDEKYIDPNDVPAGYSVEEINGETYITYGGDDAVVLSDVALDTWQYAAANQTLGTTGNDTIDGTDGDDAIQAGAGNDLVRAGDGNDVAVGGLGADRIEFTGGDNIALGGAGNDTLQGSGNGENLFFGGEDNDRLTGGDGNDTLNGGTGDDTLQGLAGDDSLIGGAGDDTFYGGDGIDYFDGGDGFDRLDLQNEHPTSSAPGLVVNMRLGYFSWTDFSYGIERFENIEMVVGASGDDSMIGNDVGVWLDGVVGNDTLLGGSGDDTLTDAYDDNELRGFAGDDYISSTSVGDDIFDGGEGNDTLYSGGSFASDPGHRGNDTFIGGAGVDNLRLAFGYGSSLIDLTAGTMQTGIYQSVLSGIENVETGRNDDTILGDGADNIFLGNDGNDSLVGGDGNDTLNGEDGNDSHFGGAGDDLLIGNFGADYYDGGDDSDTLDFTYYDAGASFDLAAGEVTFQDSAVQTIANIENVKAGDGADTLIGNAAANQLEGGAGNDTYVYALGGGNDVVIDSDGVGIFDLTTLGADDVTFADDGSGNLEITFGDGAIVAVTGQFAGGGLTEISFSDGSFDQAAIAQKAADDQSGGNSDPVAIDDVVSVDQDGTILIDAADNDTDLDGDTLTVTAVSGATNGTASVEAGQVRYTPNPGFFGTEQLTYTVDDGNGGSDTGQIDITVNQAIS